MESLYRKYRPQTFEDVVGQAHVVGTLERTGVDNVREEIITRVDYAPVRGSHKVYINALAAAERAEKLAAAV